MLDHLGLRAALRFWRWAPICALPSTLSLLRPDLVTGILGCAANCRCAPPRNMNGWTNGSVSSWPMPAMRPGCLPFLVQAGFSAGPPSGQGGVLCPGQRRLARRYGNLCPPRGARGDAGRVRGLSGAKCSRRMRRSRANASGRNRTGRRSSEACTVPVLLLQGDQDPQTPVQTVRELMVDFPHLDVSFLPRHRAAAVLCRMAAGAGRGWRRSCRAESRISGCLPQLGYARHAPGRGSKAVH